MNNRIATVFVPLTNNTDFSTGTYTPLSRIEKFIVNKALTGNVHITTHSQSANVDANIFSTYKFSSDAFTVGNTYAIWIKKVYYESPTDRTETPLVGLL